MCWTIPGNNKQNRSNNKSSSFTGTRKVHTVKDDSKVQGIVDLDTAYGKLEVVISHEFLDSIDVFVDGVTTSQPRGNLDVHTVHKPKMYQTFTKVSMFPIDYR